MSNRHVRGQKIMGDLLRQIRRRHGWTQDEIAFRAAMDESYLSNLENGHSSVSLRKFVALADALEQDPPELLRTFLDHLKVRSPE